MWSFHTKAWELGSFRAELCIFICIQNETAWRINFVTESCSRAQLPSAKGANNSEESPRTWYINTILGPKLVVSPADCNGIQAGDSTTNINSLAPACLLIDMCARVWLASMRVESAQSKEAWRCASASEIYFWRLRGLFSFAAAENHFFLLFFFSPLQVALFSEYSRGLFVLQGIHTHAHTHTHTHTRQKQPSAILDDDAAWTIWLCLCYDQSLLGSDMCVCVCLNDERTVDGNTKSFIWSVDNKNLVVPKIDFSACFVCVSSIYAATGKRIYDQCCIKDVAIIETDKWFIVDTYTSCTRVCFREKLIHLQVRCGEYREKWCI